MARVACIQLALDDSLTKEQRISTVEGLLDREKGADLILLPESWPVGFFSFDRYEEASEPLQGLIADRMSTKAKELGAYLLAGSFIEREGDKLYNTSLFFDPSGSLLAAYRKIHLFGYGSRESEILTRGSQVVVVDTALGKIGLSTCYDLRFPELYRQMVDLGAEIFLVTSAWPYPRVEHWTVLNRARAIENQAYLISCNFGGTNCGKPFLGRSMVVDPWGTVLATAGDGQAVVRAEIDREVVASCRQEFPPLRDRILRWPEKCPGGGIQ
ncbi:MAG: carbon-nitrogen family hydrolase [Clostridia bacterium]|nr:carbon-nitrogen family hydrolase [Clostridia bacterium]